MTSFIVQEKTVLRGEELSPRRVRRMKKAGEDAPTPAEYRVLMSAPNHETGELAWLLANEETGEMLWVTDTELVAMYRYVRM